MLYVSAVLNETDHVAVPVESVVAPVLACADLGIINVTGYDAIGLLFWSVRTALTSIGAFTVVVVELALSMSVVGIWPETGGGVAALAVAMK